MQMMSHQCYPQSNHKHRTTNHVACLYDGHWWLGNIFDRDYDQNDVKVTFLHPHGPAKNFSWPHREDICWVPTEHIMAVVATGRNYTIDSVTAVEIAEKLNDVLHKS